MVKEEETDYYFITYKARDSNLSYSAVIEGSPMKFVEEYRDLVILFAMEIDKEQYEKYKDVFL